MKSAILKKRSILNKTVQVGAMTFLSRILGLCREVLQARFLGTGILSDAFIIAFKLPNSLRKIFAEGALSAAFVPVFVNLMHNNKKDEANSLMTLAFLFFEGILLLLCLIVFLFPQHVIYIFAPGFDADQVIYTSKYLKILISFIVFVSSSALLAVALNSVNHFLIPAASSVILNIGFITALILGIQYSFSIDFLCYMIIGSGTLIFIMHLIAFFYYNFNFEPIKNEVFPYFKRLLIKFGPVCFCMSITEVNLALDTAFSSYLQPGTVSLMNYAFRFMHIPLGVFGVAFSTILLPHFSRLINYAPKRLGFYFLECMKFILWVTLPMVIFMSLFSRQIFVTTIIVSGKFPMERLVEVQWLLISFLLGLFFFSLNKILLNIYYSLHNTKTPALITLMATVFNFVFNFILMKILGSVGLALATTLSGILQSIMLIKMLQKQYDFQIYFGHFLKFLKSYLFQLLAFMTAFLLVYVACLKLIYGLPQDISFMLTEKFYFWLWIGPLIGAFYYAMIYTKKRFGVKMYFLD